MYEHVCVAMMPCRYMVQTADDASFGLLNAINRIEIGERKSTHRILT